jgi:hypothetical protein
VGLAVPQVSELAVALNQRQGSDYRFITLDEAERALDAALRGRTRPALAQERAQ